MYIPNEITVRTTDFTRTKMTALVVLAAMYPPTLEQNWNEDLNWQPIPYDTSKKRDDDVNILLKYILHYLENSVEIKKNLTALALLFIFIL